jgi:hypothetical protein
VRRSSIVLLIIGVVLIIGAVVWRLVAPSILVKYPPNDLNSKAPAAHATGKFTLFLVPSPLPPRTAQTYTPAPNGLAFDLDIQRSLHSVSNNGSNATIGEDDNNTIGPFPKQDFKQQYVMDRNSLKSVQSNQSWAYSPQSVVNRAPNYTVNLPFDTGDGPYNIWKNETGSAYAFSKEGESSVNGTTVFNFHGSLTNAPVQGYYIDQLAAAGVKHEFTVPQLTPVLKAQGIDVTALTAALLPTLNAAERATLTTLIAKPIPMNYTLDVDTHIQVEPTTGAIVNLQRINQTLYVRPDPSALTPLTQILNAHQNVPAAKAALAGLNKVKTGPPIKVLNLDYGQLPDSVTQVTNYANTQADKIDLVKKWIPLGLLVLGVILVIIAVVLQVVWRRRGAPTPTGGATEPAPAST